MSSTRERKPASGGTPASVPTATVSSSAAGADRCASPRTSSIASPMPATWSMARTPNAARVAIAVTPRLAEERGHPVCREPARPGREREQTEEQHRRLGADQLTDETRHSRLPQRAQRCVAKRDRSNDRDEPPPHSDVRSEPRHGHARERRATGDQAHRDDEAGRARRDVGRRPVPPTGAAGRRRACRRDRGRPGPRPARRRPGAAPTAVATASRLVLRVVP